MNKLWKKLFSYFTLISLLFAVVVFAGFYGIFNYYTLRHHEAEMKERAETIKERMEDFLGSCIGIQELDTYVKVLDDISMADAYFVSTKGKVLTCGCSCDSTYVIEKEPSAEVRAFANEVILGGEYTLFEKQTNGISTSVFVGIPVEEDGAVTAAVVLVDNVDVDQESFFKAVGILSGCILIALLASAILSSVLSKRFMNPIEKIATTIKSLAKGNYSAKTQVHDNNEIGVLAKETDVLAEKLAFASRESERVAKMQKDYIASVSHELRTPVSVIRSSLEALNDKMVPEDKISEYQKQMLSETISLQRLVNDMLEISRLENEDFVIEKEVIDLLMVVEDAIRSIRLLAKEREIMIAFDRPQEEWTILGDYGRLRQMFVTVLDNAIKYSDGGKSITIETKKLEGYYVISVADEGKGISAEDQAHIFEKFYREGSAGGTGLGLSIMKSIANRHNITVKMHSVMNMGTKFTFEIPLCNK